MTHALTTKLIASVPALIASWLLIGATILPVPIA